MHRYIRLTTKLAALLCACALSLAASAAQAERHGPRRGPASFAARHAEQLGLDAEAQAKIAAIVAQSGERDAALREELDQARRRMYDLMNGALDTDEAVLLERADAIGAIETEIEKNRLRSILQIRNLMTPEQREQLLELREGRRSEHRRSGRRACRYALEDLCPDAEPGRATLGCLQEHWDELSPACHDTFDFSKRRPPRH